MRRWFFALLFLPLLLGAVATPRATADGGAAAAVEPARVTRMVEHGDHLALDIAVREMVPKDGMGPHVWLVGAVHIADASYYRALQAVLDLYPVVLYESVKPKGAGELRTDTVEDRVEDTRARLGFLARVVEIVLRHGGILPPDADALGVAAAHVDARLGHLVVRAWKDAWGRAIDYVWTDVPGGRASVKLRSLGADGKPGGDGPDADLEVSAGQEEPADSSPGKAKSDFNVQEELADLLGLAYQGEAIDYAHPGWIPSDMSIDQVQRAIRARGGNEEVIQDVLEAEGLQGFAIRLSLGFLRLMDGLTDGAVKLGVKAALITTLGEGPAEPQAGGVFDEATIGAIIQDRNGVVLHDLDRLLARRKDLPSVAIFYGAGHLPDFQRHLAERGFVPGRTRWLRAMEVDFTNAGPFARELRQRIQEEVENRR